MKMEFLIEFILPLLRQITRGDDKTPFDISSNNELFQQQPSHNSFSRARVISQNIPEGLPRKHLFIDRRNLMGKRFNRGSMDSQIRIK